MKRAARLARREERAIPVRRCGVGQGFRFDPGHRSDLMAATNPI
jgi:hypothetical protein